MHLHQMVMMMMLLKVLEQMMMLLQLPRDLHLPEQNQCMACISKSIY